MQTNFDLAADEPADTQWTRRNCDTADAPLVPKTDECYRVLFPTDTLGFCNRGRYWVETLTSKTVQLRGYGRIFKRGELTFLAR